MRMIGIDVGGAFTDPVYCDMTSGALAIHEVSTTPDDPSRAILQGVEQLVRKSLTFTRFHLGHADFGSEIWRRSVEETTSAVVEGRLKTPIGEAFAFAHAQDMLRKLALRSVAGKLILAVNP